MSLRPVLFNVFINNPEVATKGTLIKLVDDVKVKRIADMFKGRLWAKEIQTGWRNGSKGTLWNSVRTNVQSCTWDDMSWGLPAWLECGSAKKGSGICVRLNWTWSNIEPRGWPWFEQMVEQVISWGDYQPELSCYPPIVKWILFAKWTPEEYIAFLFSCHTVVRTVTTDMSPTLTLWNHCIFLTSWSRL